MNRLSSLVALGAIVVAGAFAGTAAQASANVSIAFNVYNGDSTASMIRTSTSSGISQLGAVAAIAPGGYDPASGAALFTAATPVNNGDHVDGYVGYANSVGLTSLCTFNMRITRLGLHSFKAHFWIPEIGTNCSVPADLTNSDGAFTSTTSTLTWKA